VLARLGVTTAEPGATDSIVVPDSPSAIAIGVGVFTTIGELSAASSLEPHDAINNDAAIRVPCRTSSVRLIVVRRALRNASATRTHPTNPHHSGHFHKA